MQVDVGLKFHVRGSTGKVDTLLVDAPSALVGTAGHCEVRLPVGTAEHEHLEILVVDGHVHLTTLGGATPPLLDGYPFVSGEWPEGSVVELGSTVMSVEPVDLRNNVKQRSPFWILFPVPLIAAAVLLGRQSSTVVIDAPPTAPQLLDPPVAACPAPNSPTLANFAGERARIGYAKRERSPFARADGIEAVGLLETAAICFAVAGRPDDERETRSVAQHLRGKLEEEYRTRRVRLEHAARVADSVALKRELNSLLPLLAHRDGPYVDWLKNVDRWATTENARREGKKL